MFQKNLVVWKQRIEVRTIGKNLNVSEELSSVETILHLRGAEAFLEVSEELSSVETF